MRRRKALLVVLLTASLVVLLALGFALLQPPGAPVPDRAMNADAISASPG